MNKQTSFSRTHHTLALFGGKPLLKKPLPPSNNITKEEQRATMRVLKSGVLSEFVGHAGSYFLGGPEVKGLEASFAKQFNVHYAVSFSSATTALNGAFAALQLLPGSEVIVSPYTMSASVTTILENNLVPVFCDVDKKTFCLNPEIIPRLMSKKTKAILVTNLFGGAPDYYRILALAKKHRLLVIEDNAQAPGGRYKNNHLGTIGDIGVFSFNFHKVIHTGEGGMLVTNNKELAFGAQLKRNHGENALDDLQVSDRFSLGSNFRLTELQAAIAHEQLKKLDTLNEKRKELAAYLTKQLRAIKGITPCFIRPGVDHVYYVYPFLFNEKIFGMSRKQFAQAMTAEGFALNEGYQKPLYLLGLFQNAISYRYLPWLQKRNYQRGRCPVVEQLYEKEMLVTSICRYPLTQSHIDIFVQAIKKIYQYRQEFRKVGI